MKDTDRKSEGFSVKISEESSQEVIGFCQRLLGPVADVSDFLSDKIRFYRYNSAMNTLARAHEIALQNKIETNCVPVKFLVPFLERCSLEDEESELIERWASLLVNASSEFHFEYVTYSRILGEITPVEARLLDNVHERYFQLTKNLDIEGSERNSAFIIGYSGEQLKHAFERWSDNYQLPLYSETLKTVDGNENEVLEIIQDRLNCFGVCITKVRYPITLDIPLKLNEQEEITVMSNESCSRLYKDAWVGVYSLSNAGLIEISKYDIVKQEKHEFGIEWLQLTPLGLAFIMACKTPGKPN